MRLSYILFLVFFTFFSLDVYLYWDHYQARKQLQDDVLVMKILAKEFGLTDLAVSTEARYTRHPAVSDPAVPFMDHPGAIEHFPSGSFWTPQVDR
jgi:hypothetical protein